MNYTLPLHRLATDGRVVADRVRAGHHVTLTLKGRPVAEVQPIASPEDREPPGDPRIPHALRKLAAQGHARLADPSRPVPPPGAPSDVTMAQIPALSDEE